jgi:hypothetical protein
MTEKRTAHYPLTQVKELIEEGKVFSTITALETAAALKYTFEDMVNVIRDLEISDLKLTVTDNVLIVSFKEL